MKLYHRDLGIPAELLKQVPQGLFNLVWGRHADEQRFRDNQQVPLIRKMHVSPESIVELGWDEGFVKMVVRERFTNEFDVVLVLANAREQATLFVKTVWLNHVNDDHTTLDPSKYERA